MLSTSLQQWHNRLGHAYFVTVTEALTKYVSDQSVSISGNEFCKHCQIAKSHELSFLRSHKRVTTPFHVLYLDLWTTPLKACITYRYFLSIVEDYSRFDFFTSRKGSN